VVLELVVLRCGDIKASAAFYSALGLPLVEERHGSGARDYAAVIAGLVVELYPASDARPAESSTQLGVAVASIADAIRSAAEVGGSVRSADDYSAVVVDPDGRTVRLSTPFNGPR
jgi:catechol 2,3-dioxygenase-like lactoylglutathione lyase family enzyme